MPPSCNKNVIWGKNGITARFLKYKMLAVTKKLKKAVDIIHDVGV